MVYYLCKYVNNNQNEREMLNLTFKVVQMANETIEETRREIVSIMSLLSVYCFLFMLTIFYNYSKVIIEIHKNKIMLRKRSIIETINDELKNVAQLVHSRHRSIDNFMINVLSTLAAYCCFDKKPSINVDFIIDREPKQLSFWT